jgi:hypothetical protein
MGGGKMSPESQRIAIAEACGWKHIKHTNQEDVDIESRSITYWSGLTGVPPKFIHDQNRIIIPDYLNDLNAMHAAEEVMTEMQRIDYSNHLYDIACKHQEVTEKWRYLSMSAAQRAEALLKTLNLWKE